MKALPLLAMACVALARPASAEFLLLAPAPIVAPSAPPPIAAAPRPRRPAPPPTVAEGFGEDVPLRVAARMIVPRRMGVAFGAGADPEALVSFRGGKPWPDVLADALHPHKLRMVSNGARALILR